MTSQVREANQLANFKPSREKRQKEKNRDKRKDRPGNSDDHLALVRKLPCCLHGCSILPAGTAHHIKATGLRGGATRSPDRYAIPLCWDHHINGVERQGSKNELSWLSNRGVEALDLAAALWMARGDFEKMRKIVLEHKRGKQ